VSQKNDSPVLCAFIGFNGVLAMVGVGGMFWILSVRVFIFAMLTTMLATILFNSVVAALSPVGLPALTFPTAVVLVLWTLIGYVAFSLSLYFLVVSSTSCTSSVAYFPSFQSINPTAVMLYL
jgi:urea transporter